MEKVNQKAPSAERTAFLVSLVFAGLFLLRTAWISDDAFITLRTVDNFLHGYGLTWNVFERVQAYTHPLWLMLLSAVISITREYFFTTVITSIIVSLAVIAVILIGFRRSWWQMVLVTIILLLSKAFIDYSTSGLENPLMHLLWVLFIFLYLQEGPVTLKRFAGLCILASMGFLNRMDSALLFIPALVDVIWSNRSAKNFAILLIAFLPFIGWEIFSIIYYGFPFPNTAYAKLGGEYPLFEIFKQSTFYFLHTINFDPISFSSIILGLAIVLMNRKRKELFIAAGIGLYLVYIIRIGGDFMGGRLFSALILGSIILLFKNLPTTLNSQVGLIAGSLLALGLFSPFSPIWSNSNDLKNTNRSDLVDTFMIADERGFYFQDLGFINARKYPEWPDCSVRINRLRTNDKFTSEASTIIQIGVAGFCAGPTVRIIDQMGLADPLLSRLPPRYSPYWRPGHLARIIPDGYKETVQSGENKLKDPQLAVFYDQLRRITQGEIWSVSRFRTILSMNLGRYNYLIDKRFFRYPTLKIIHLEDEQTLVPEGTSLDDAHLTILFRDGILIDLGMRSYSKTIRMGIDQLNIYQIRFLNGNEEVGREILHRVVFPNTGLAVVNINVPPKVSRIGFDHVWILPVQNSRGFSFDQPFTLNSQDHPELDSSRFGFLELKIISSRNPLLLCTDNKWLIGPASRRLPQIIIL